MKINYINNTNFTAKEISSTKVKHLENNQYVDKNVNFLELEKDSNFDKKLTYDLMQDWDTTVTRDYYKSFKDYIDSRSTQYYVVTYQNDKFEKLDKNKVLSIVAMSDMKEDKSYFIKYLQTNPKYIKKQKEKSYYKALFDFFFKRNDIDKDREYSNIGSGTIKTIISHFKPKKIELISFFSAINFYKKLGFKCVEKDDKTVMQWTED